MDYSNFSSAPLTREAIAVAAERVRAMLGDRPLAVQPDVVVVSPALAAAVEAERRKVERQRARGYRHPGAAGRLYKTLYGAAMSCRRGAGLAAHLARDTEV
jgi:hypothetical protein